MPKVKRTIEKQLCSENPKNYCLQQIKPKKKEVDEYIITDYDIFFENEKPKIIDLIHNIDNALKKTKIKKVDNSDDNLKEIIITDVNQIIDERMNNNKIFTFYIELGEDLYKYIIQLEDNYEMDYYRVLRIIGHTTKNIIENMNNNKGNFNPIDRLNKVYISRIGVVIHDSEDNVLKFKQFEVVIKGFDESLDNRKFII